VSQQQLNLFQLAARGATQLRARPAGIVRGNPTINGPKDMFGERF